MIIPISIWPKYLMNCFMIRGDHGIILVDTGVPGSSRRIFEQIKEQGFEPSDIQLIIVTHGHMDHFGSVGEIQKQLNIPVLAHHLDVPFYQKGEANVGSMKPTVLWAHLFKRLVKDIKTRSFTPDIIMDQEEYDLNEWVTGAKIIHTPGHTPGSISVVLPNKEAIIMDMMSSGVGLGGIVFHSRVKHPAFHDDLSLLKQSFERILEYDLDIFYLGHGKPVNRQQVLKYVDKFLKPY